MAFEEDLLLISHVVRICHIPRQHLHRCRMNTSLPITRALKLPVTTMYILKQWFPKRLGFCPLK